MMWLYPKLKGLGFFVCFSKKSPGFVFYCFDFYVEVFGFFSLGTIVHIWVCVTGACSTCCIRLDECSAWVFLIMPRAQSIHKGKEGWFLPPLLAALSVGELVFSSWRVSKSMVVLLGGDMVLFNIPVVIANSSSQDDSDSSQKHRHKNNTFAVTISSAE